MDQIMITRIMALNKELHDEIAMASIISFVRGQMDQWLGRMMMRSSENNVSTTVGNQW